MGAVARCPDTTDANFSDRVGFSFCKKEALGVGGGQREVNRVSETRQHFFPLSPPTELSINSFRELKKGQVGSRCPSRVSMARKKKSKHTESQGISC